MSPFSESADEEHTAFAALPVYCHPSKDKADLCLPGQNATLVAYGSG